MRFEPTEPFWEAYAQLPAAVKQRARRAFRFFQQGAQSPPFHPSLRIRKMKGHANDRGYVLELGENSYEDTGQNLINNAEVRRAFLGG